MSDDTPAILRAPVVKTNMTLSRKAWTWLKAEAADRAIRDGGKPNMSDIVDELVRREAEKG